MNFLDSDIVLLLEHIFHKLLSVLDVGVPVVLNCVVCAHTSKDEGDGGPATAIDVMHQEQRPLLFLAPLHSLDEGIEIIMPSLPALLGTLTSQLLRKNVPVSGTELVHKFEQSTILLQDPLPSLTFCGRGPFKILKIVDDHP